MITTTAQHMAQTHLPKLHRPYVALMMQIISRGLVSASQVDEEIQRELSGFPKGFILQMTVFPSGPGFTLQVQPDGSLKSLNDFQGKPNLVIKFKHMAHAFLVFSFQEGTARAFANDRMVADGDLAFAIRLVRILDKMEALILPRLVAGLAVKRYPTSLGLSEKINKAARIYGKVAQSFVQRS